MYIFFQNETYNTNITLNRNYKTTNSCFLHSQICRKMCHSSSSILFWFGVLLKKTLPEALCCALGRNDYSLGLFPAAGLGPPMPESWELSLLLCCISCFLNHSFLVYFLIAQGRVYGEGMVCYSNNTLRKGEQRDCCF